jgi:hypothetical protein
LQTLQASETGKVDINVGDKSSCDETRTPHVVFPQVLGHCAWSAILPGDDAPPQHALDAAYNEAPAASAGVALAAPIAARPHACVKLRFGFTMPGQWLIIFRP